MMIFVIFTCFNIINAGEELFFNSFSSENHQISHNACDHSISQNFNFSEAPNREGFTSNNFEFKDASQTNIFKIYNVQTTSTLRKEDFLSTDFCINEFSAKIATNVPKESNSRDFVKNLNFDKIITKLPRQPISAILKIEVIGRNVEQNENIPSDNDRSFENSLKYRRNYIYKKYLIKLKNDINDFIKKNFADNYVEFYTRRLLCIEYAFNLLNHDSINSETNHLLNSAGRKIFKVLNILCPRYKNKDEFNLNTSQDFISRFDFELSKSVNGRSNGFISNLSEDYRKHYFYLEIIKLYKYIDKVPELLFLCGLFSERSHCDISFFLNIMNSFIENIDNLEDYKVFTLCMINKAIISSNKKNLDLFTFSRYVLICHKEHFNLHFLLWEICPGKRGDMKKRIQNNGTLKFNDVDKKHLKVILLIYLYQHFDFLIYFNFSEKEISCFNEFALKVLTSKNCFACDLDVYLEIVKSQLNNLKQKT